MPGSVNLATGQADISFGAPWRLQAASIQLAVGHRPEPEW